MTKEQLEELKKFTLSLCDKNCDSHSLYPVEEVSIDGRTFKYCSLIIKELIEKGYKIN
jgi:hypothetical protein